MAVAPAQTPLLETPLGGWIPFAVTFFLIIVVMKGLQAALLKDPSINPERRLPRQVSMLVLSLVALLALIVALPAEKGWFITDDLKVGLVSLVGIAIAALLTLSSTTIAANAMAGFMLRSVQSFRAGDFVRVGEYFGRVTERGLFHTEIQTEDRDLVSLPNLFLATNPVRVVRASGTIISAELSLGYDVAHADAERLLIRAAESIGLDDPFVWITELGNFAVGYRVCGFHADVKTLISARSKLRASVLDTLHRAKIEIMSPSVMNQRPLDPTQPLIPRVRATKKDADAQLPEELVFDKAEAAEQVEQLRSKVVETEARIKELEKAAKSDDDAAAQLEHEQTLLAQAKELLEWAEEPERADERAEPTGDKA